MDETPQQSAAFALPCYVGSSFEAANLALLNHAPADAGESLRDFVSRYPQILNSYVLQGALAAIPVDHRHDANPRYVSLALLEAVARRLRHSPEDYPVGLGPIEQIWEEVRLRHISSRHAEEMMAEPSLMWQLSLAYVRALSRYAFLEIQQRERWRDGWILQEMLLTAVTPLCHPPSDTGELRPNLGFAFSDMYEETVSDWLLAALPVLMTAPDGRLYRRAQRLGDVLLSRLRSTDDTEGVGRVLFRLAGLSLDPYKGLPLTQPQQREQLRRRLEFALDSAERDQLNWAEADMPEMQQALKIAAQQYAEAASLRLNAERGLSLKGLFDTLYIQRQLGEPVTDTDLNETATQALAYLDPVDDKRHILSIQATLEQTPQRNKFTDGHQPSKSRRNIQPASLAYEESLFGALANAPAKPIPSLRALTALHTQARTLGAGQLENLWNRELTILQSVDRESVYRVPGAFFRGDADKYQSVLELAAQVRQAKAQQTADREDVAIALLEATPVEPDGVWKPLRETRTWYLLTLGIGAAVNKVDTQPSESVGWYSYSLQRALRLDLESVVADLVRRMGWIARDNPTSEVAARVCAYLFPLTKALLGYGEPVQYEFYRTCQFALAAGTRDGITPLTAAVLRQMTKGWAFAATLEANEGYAVTADPEGQRQLRLIRELENSEALTEAASDTEVSVGFDDDALLTTYISEREVRSGATAQEKLSNMQRVFDKYVFDEFTRSAGDESRVLSFGEIHGLLGPDTVLADIVLGTNPEGRLTVYTMLYTSDHQFVIGSVSNLPGLIEWHGDGRKLSRHALATTVSEVRQLITNYPGPVRNATQEADYALHEITKLIFGTPDGIEELVRIGHTGRNRLIVVPHGPLHYLPFHLLPTSQGILADHFTVTVLPNLAMLRPRTRRQASIVVQSFGMSFASQPFGLPTMEASIPEAEAIASRFGLIACTDEEATKERFREALQESTFAHLSTHGRNNAAGGAFHHVYLWPSDEHSDGRLHAYELLDLQLDQLRLLSLSACETALGRFDLLDNLRGLPAAFFLRGTQTLIGTLWPAEVEASQLFFTTLYEHLRVDPHAVVPAFAAAQNATRARYTQYRDWGPFYLAGGR
ncbi:CHAT domain-containing protein [Arthrobacter sp. OV608]|uniref:CHAT domain-containing protein n=1 Tax=Arthrobacter sp. OV608 TaxID=1882768 RepID=UPI0008C5D673|nr:CHAT domain-containing protein [Arthrobacter sp. OV608]SEQ79906.1 CHAT domain-containing protein [Arthrobacter sp. OV608]